MILDVCKGRKTTYDIRTRRERLATSNDIKMGRGEAVTQRTLDPLFGGSNPPAPAKNPYIVLSISYIVLKKIRNEDTDENIANRRIWTYSTNQV